VIHQKRARAKFLAGKPHCLSSSNSWMTVIPNGSVFVIRDVPPSTTERFQEAVGNAGQVEVRTINPP
jgi:hypothetical protein